MPRPYRFIPSAVLLHFASTVAPADVPPQIPCREGSSSAAARHLAATEHLAQTRSARANATLFVGKKNPGPIPRHDASAGLPGRVLESQLANGSTSSRQRTSTSLSFGPAISACCVDPGERACLPRIRTDIVPVLRWRARQARSTNPPGDGRTTSGSAQTWLWRRTVKLRRRSVMSLRD